MHYFLKVNIFLLDYLAQNEMHTERLFIAIKSFGV